MSRSGSVRGSVVFEYPSVKEQRHEFFTKRKRMQKAEQTVFKTVVKTEERDSVHNRLHKVSREVTGWVSQFSAPVIVLESLKDMRESINYGTRMNRRLHSLPFAALQEMVSYKASWEGIPSHKVDPEYTSQQCSRTECQHTESANRHKKRFKCQECKFEDHSDRKAAVCCAEVVWRVGWEEADNTYTNPRTESALTPQPQPLGYSKPTHCVWWNRTKLS